MNIVDALKLGAINVKVKPNSRETIVLDYDIEKKEFLVSVAAPPDKNKANIELIRFLSKLAKREIQIIKGKTSVKKVLR
jgi:uncharacterized protein (TIGR00251 family)